MTVIERIFDIYGSFIASAAQKMPHLKKNLEFPAVRPFGSQASQPHGSPAFWPPGLPATGDNAVSQEKFRISGSRGRIQTA